MRTVITTLAVLALVPATAFADDSKPAQGSSGSGQHAVLTIAAPANSGGARAPARQWVAVQHPQPLPQPTVSQPAAYRSKPKAQTPPQINGQAKEQAQPMVKSQPASQSDPTPPSQPAAESQPASQDQPATQSQPAAQSKNAEEAPAKPANGYLVPQSVAYEGGKVPEGAFLEKRPNLALVGTGLGIAGAAYAASVITAAVSCPPQSTCSATVGAAWLYLPLVGPFVTAAMATSPGGAALAAFDGGLQVVGGALAVAGLVAKSKFVVWQDKSASLSVTPSAAGAPGISLTLTHM